MAPRLLLGLGLVSLLAAGCDRAPDRSPADPSVVAIRVTVAPVALSSRAIPVQVTGTVARRAEAPLSFKIGGVVRTVAVRPGDRVEAGQQLAALDLAEIDAQLEQARSALTQARRDQARAAELTRRGVIASAQMENATTGLEQAEAACRIAEFNRRFAVIVAPARGRILRRMAEPNELVAPGSPALLFASEEEGWVARAGLPERDAARTRLGNPATLHRSGRPAGTGVVSQIAEAADSSTRTTEVEVQLAGPPSGLRSGSVVEIEIQPDDVPTRPTVPLAALVEGEGRQAHLFLVAPDGRSVKRVTVTVSEFFGDTAFLATALPGGARVALAGAEFLRDGAPVEIAE